MRLRVSFYGLLIALLAPVWVAGADNKAAPAAPVIAKLIWLAGSWRVEKKGHLMDEQWMTPAGGVMLGASRTVAKGRVVEQAFRQIREGPGGDLFYVVQSVGQSESAYQASQITDTEAVFENAEQNFPRKISYALQPDGTLLVVVEGLGSEGETKTVELTFQRTVP